MVLLAECRGQMLEGFVDVHECRPAPSTDEWKSFAGKVVIATCCAENSLIQRVACDMTSQNPAFSREPLKVCEDSHA